MATYTIKDVIVWTAHGSFEDRPPDRIELTFEETSKKMKLNKSRLAHLTERYGNETDNWIGKEVDIFLKAELD